jgi:predicted DsbA family dithiol-disulfide isomerase
MLSNLNSSGALYGINFGKLELMVNSHNALEASEFARANGKIKEYHSSLMDAYFRDLKDIGNLQVLADLCKPLGLNSENLINAVKNRTYETILNNTASDAHKMKINSTPTFVIDNKYTIVGAQPIEAFRKILDTL